MSSGIPELTDSFLSGQDVLYRQFNDVEFYVEDQEQEHLYFNVLKRLFPYIRFEKIFPLNGKRNVLEAARLNVNEGKKVYIVDLDFDGILGGRVSMANLFYLERYSIENYLISKFAVYEVIRIKSPKLKNTDIDLVFNWDKVLREAIDCLKELSSCFVVIHYRQLGSTHYGINVSRDFDLSGPRPKYRMNFVSDYFAAVDIDLKSRNRRYVLSNQMRRHGKHFRDILDCISNIPGKYLLIYLKERLFSFGLINQMNVDSFSYLLSKEFDPTELDYLRVAVSRYISS